MRASPDPSLRPVWPGTRGPSSGTPDRRPSSVRRTAVVDIVFPSPSAVELRGSGRDLLTTSTGHRLLSADSTLLGIDLTGTDGAVVHTARTGPELANHVPGLVGHSPSAGFRRRLGQVLPHEVAGGTLTGQLLDDTPVVMLIAWASLSRRGLAITPPDQPRRPMPLDICAGWVSGGVMASAPDIGEPPYMGEGPPAGDLQRADDLHAWHSLTVLPIGSMRRRRRLDLAASVDAPGTFDLDVLFRDSYTEPDGTESVVHEYSITGRILGNGTVERISAVPHVLPGPQCPAAATSADRLVGKRLADVRALVGTEFHGTSTCTHLNDTLRSIGDLAGLLPALVHDVG